MSLPLTRLIMYVRDVQKLSRFYRTHFELSLVEEIGDDWVVLKAGTVELALHRVGESYRDLPMSGAASNTKLVFTVETGLMDRREHFVKAGVAMRPLKRFDGFPYLMCDGEDPEGNVFQLLQLD